MTVCKFWLAAVVAVVWTPNCPLMVPLSVHEQSVSWSPHCTGEQVANLSIVRVHLTNNMLCS